MTEAPRIHPSALVDPEADLAPDVEIGPFCVVGPKVVLREGARLKSHVVLQGRTILGPKVEVFPFACLGLPPQDRKFDGSETVLQVGARTVIREYVSMQPGSQKGGVTQVGEDALIMAYCHVAHDCRVGDHVVMANACQLAGHVSVGDRAFLGGVTTVHQFVRIGELAMTGSSTRIVQDVPPFMTAVGNPAYLAGPNKVGLQRAGFSDELRRHIKRSFVEIFRGGRRQAAVARIESELAPSTPEIARLCEFIKSSQRGVTGAKRS